MKFPFGALLDVSSVFTKSFGFATVIPNPSFDNNRYIDPDKWCCLLVHGYDYLNADPEQGGFHVYSMNNKALDTFILLGVPQDVGDLEDDY